MEYFETGAAKPQMQDALFDYRLPMSIAAFTEARTASASDTVPPQFPSNEDLICGDKPNDDSPKLNDKQKKQIDAAADVIKRTSGDPSKEPGGMKIVAEALKDAYAKGDRTGDLVTKEINAKLKETGCSISVGAWPDDHLLAIFQKDGKPTGSALRFKRPQID